MFTMLACGQPRIGIEACDRFTASSATQARPAPGVRPGRLPAPPRRPGRSPRVLPPPPGGLNGMAASKPAQPFRIIHERRNRNGPQASNEPATRAARLPRPLPSGFGLLDNRHNHRLRTVRLTEKITSGEERMLWRTTDYRPALTGSRGPRSTRPRHTRPAALTTSWGSGPT